MNIYHYEDYEVTSREEAVDISKKIFFLFSFFRNLYSFDEVVAKLAFNIDKISVKTHVGIVSLNESIIGFSMYNITFKQGFKIVCFIFASVLPEYQSKGVYSFLIKKRNAKHQPDFIVGRPHNPFIYEGLCKLSSIIYPNLKSGQEEPIPPFYKNILKLFIKNESTYDDKYSVVRNVFSGTDNYEFPLSNNEYINIYFAKYLSNRDALMVVVDMRHVNNDYKLNSTNIDSNLIQ